MFNFKEISPLYTDFYQLTMAQAYFKSHKHEESGCFDYFFRKLPFAGGYVIFAGLNDLLRMVESLRFNAADIDYLNKSGFEADFLEYLKSWRFGGAIYGMQEGEVVFPFEPLLRIEGTLLDAQLIESLLLNVLNFQSLIATKANRIRRSAGPRVLSDFGLRRAQGFGALGASRAAIIGGFDNTSNAFAGQLYKIDAVGTMAHSFIESFDLEIDAFREYAKSFPNESTLLVDTYNTLKSGLPNAIIVARELEAAGSRLKAVRLDSGDLAYLAKKARKMLDSAGFPYVKIIVSNQLDEYVIKSLLDQGAPIDIFGVGTSLVIGKPDGAIDGVYKLSANGHVPKLKISENIQKTTLPGIKSVVRFSDEEGMFYADCIKLTSEDKSLRMTHPFDKEKALDLSAHVGEELFICHMSDGKITKETEPLFSIRDRVYRRLERLPDEHKRFHYPHIYKVGISDGVSVLRQEIIKKQQELL